MRKYDKYKKSNVPWIGEIPEHWDLKRMRFVARLYNGNSLNDTEKSHYADTPDDDDSMPYIASKDIDRDTEFIDYANGIRIPKNEPDFKVAPAGTSLLCIEGGSAGKKMGFVNQDVCFVNKLCCFDAVINNKFLYYYIKSKSFWEVFSQNIQGMIGGVTISRIKDFAVPVPSDEEQDAIVAYLDKKCGDIDKAIETQQKHKDLLNELRQNIVTSAVTSGVDVHEAYEDSGFECLGKIPSTWTATILKRQLRTKLMYGANVGAEDSNPDDPRYIRITDLNDDGSLKEDSFVSLSPEAAKDYMLQSGDILFARSGATVGKTYIHRGDFPACFAGYLIKAQCGKNLLPDYLFYYTKSKCFDNWKDSIYVQSTIPNIGAEKYGLMPISIPPVEEQLRIVDYISKRTKNLIQQISEAEQKIELLRKLRASIIQEVITGIMKVS